MRDLLTLLTDAGAWAAPSLWLPVALWTLAALLTEGALRLTSGPHPAVLLGIRRALLWALPAGILAANLLPSLLPEAAVERVAVFTPTVLTLPDVTASASPEALLSPTPLPLAPLAAGLALLAALVVACVRASHLARGLWRLRTLSVGTREDADVQAVTTHIARKAGVTRRVHAVTTAAPTVPFTYGWRRPIVVVPTDLADAPVRLHLVLAHEVAHIARGDFASGVAERALGAAFGWHPLVGAISRQIDLDRERVADATVLSERPEERRDYADLLLSFSRLPSPALALGAARGSHSLTSRITTMQTPPLSPVRLRRIGTLGRILGLTLFIGAVGGAGLIAVGPLQAATPAASGASAVPASMPELASVEPTSALLSEETAAPQARVIEGVVSDASNGRPLAGASVAVVGTTTGAATGPDGRFTLTGVDPGSAQVRITRAGYEPLTVVPRPDEPLRVGLVPTSGQSTEAEIVEIPADNVGGAPTPDIYEVVETAPQLIGGMTALTERIVYPADALDEGVQGRVFVQFVVNKQGRVEGASCTGPRVDDRLCTAALAAVRASTFEPGRQRGEAVKVRFTLPVNFAIAADE